MSEVGSFFTCVCRTFIKPWLTSWSEQGWVRRGYSTSSATVSLREGYERQRAIILHAVTRNHRRPAGRRGHACSHADLRTENSGSCLFHNVTQSQPISAGSSDRVEREREQQIPDVKDKEENAPAAPQTLFEAPLRRPGNSRAPPEPTWAAGHSWQRHREQQGRAARRAARRSSQPIYELDGREVAEIDYQPQGHQQLSFSMNI